MWVDAVPKEIRTKPLAFAEVKKFASTLTGSDFAAEADRVRAVIDSWFSADAPLVVKDSAVRSVDDLRVLVRFLIDPAYAGGYSLYLIGKEPTEAALGDGRTDLAVTMLWERLDHVRQRAEAREVLDGLPPMTPIEERLLEELRAVGLNPRVQYDIPPFRVDFAFEDVNLAVEADGREWHDADRDRTRDLKLQEQGWHVMHFTGAEIWSDARACAEQIAVRRSTLDDLGPTGLAAETSPGAGAAPSLPRRDLDSQQREAVSARPGVVQVIAPAGSGKTTVLVERVRFLMSHGMPASRILSTTFNRAAADEMRRRFDAAGISTDAETRTFHSLGHAILKDEGKLPPTMLQSFSWKRLAREVSNLTGQWIEPEELENWIGYFKLTEMKTPDELEAAPGDELAAARIRAFELYERERQRRKAWSYDDLIFLSLRLLQSDAEIRARWQKRWWYILVDEYQDIEPAQEQLVLLLSSPNDNLFIVGDEDQCIYTWRRADVRRIMTMHRRFPSVQQSILKVNYRSGESIVSASRVLIENNRIRFAKGIVPHRKDAGSIERIGFADDPQNVDQLSHAFARVRDCSDPTEMAVLCRTNTLLRDLAIECITNDVKITANDRILKPSPAEEVVLAYLMMCLRPDEAEPSHVETALRNPNVYLIQAHAPLLLKALRSGKSFVEAFQGLPIPERESWRRREQAKIAPRLDRLATLTKPTLAMVHLRRELGLDDHFDARAREGAASEDADALNGVSGLADRSGSTAELLEQLLVRKSALDQARKGRGVELTSIHGAKGREWGNVLLIGADEKRLPLTSVIDDERPSFTESDGWEDERRLAYVAMTRAKDRLTILWSEEPSPFVLEALDGGDPTELERATRSRLAQQEEGRRKAAKGDGAKGAKTRTRKEFVAKHVSTCSLCDSHVVPGEVATFFEDRAVHTRCIGDAAVLPRGGGSKSKGTDASGARSGSIRATSAAGRGAERGRRGFPASFEGKCPVCRKKFPEGELILPIDGRYGHVKCGLSRS